jgi:transcriptional regulator with XRE-family HTH domain
MNFPKNLRYLRKKSGLKQDDMLGYLRITRSTWSNYEIGHTIPKLVEILNISRFFGITLDELVVQDLESDEPLPRKKGQRQPRRVSASPESIPFRKRLPKQPNRILSMCSTNWTVCAMRYEA